MSSWTPRLTTSRWAVNRAHTHFCCSLSAISTQLQSTVEYKLHNILHVLSKYKYVEPKALGAQYNSRSWKPVGDRVTSESIYWSGARNYTHSDAVLIVIYTNEAAAACSPPQHLSQRAAVVSWPLVLFNHFEYLSCISFIPLNRRLLPGPYCTYKKKHFLLT